MNPLALIPSSYRAAAGMTFTVLALFLFFAWGHRSGAASVQSKWDAEHAAQAAALAKRATKQAASDARVITRYVDRVRTVREAGETIIREVQIHVPAAADAACVIPAGFVRLHDAAASGVPVADAAGGADAPASGIALSTVAETVADNYTGCRETREQLIGLQAWAESIK